MLPRLSGLERCEPFVTNTDADVDEGAEEEDEETTDDDEEERREGGCP